MALSLNQIVGILSDRVGQPFNTALIEQLKVIVNYKRANYMKQLLERNPEQRKFFVQEFSVELEKADQSLCPSDPTGCFFLVSKVDVPTPVRGNTTLFDYVGTLDRLTPFTYYTPEYLEYNQFNRYTSIRPKYYYANNKLYILNNTDLLEVVVRGIFSDPRALESFICRDASGNLVTTTCLTDDDPYPAPEDIIQAIIRDILQVELRNQFPEKEETRVDEPEIKQ